MKSHEQDCLTVCECIIIDAYAKCTTDKVNVKRDLITIKKRLEHEGLSFLTITLPMFGDCFFEALAARRITPLNFSGWRKFKSLPAFLRGLTGLVFSVETGGLFDDPDIAAIEGVRQIAYSFKKLSLPCTPERESVALSGYKEVECSLSDTVYPRDTSLFIQVSDLLWGSVLYEDFDLQRYIPKHGPGQTAEGTSGNRKYSQRTWYERLEPFFPSDIYLMSCVSQLMDESDGIQGVQFIRQEDELPVKVTCVPKTLKGPRIIAMEPVCMQYAQQALSSYIIKRIETSRYTSGHINFTDQKVNQKLALTASHDLSYGTLDLSSASDRVPLSMVSLMLQSRPDFLDAILACRSQAAQMPSGEIIHLKKFASMGSALCFPVESMYFYTVILCARLRKHNLPVTLRNIYNMSRRVYVYGDDIIVPTDEVEVISEALTEFSCKVNTTKSFWTGKFRESCGMDAYDGHCVTPTYVRSLRPTDKGSTPEILSNIAASNLFYKKGYWKTAMLLRTFVEAVTGELPVVKETSPGLGWFSYTKYITPGRWNRHLHRIEVLTYVNAPIYRRDVLGGWSALLKFFISTYNGRKWPYEIDEKHLERSPRSGTSCIKRRWTTPY